MKERRLIREHIQKLLKNKTAVGDRVFSNRSTPASIEELPLINIYTKSESVDPHNEAPKSYRRSLNLVLEVIGVGRDDCALEDLVDSIADEIEKELENDETLDGKADKLSLTGLQYTVEPDGQSPVGSLVLNYSIIYYQEVGPDCFPPFETMSVDYKIGHHGQEEIGEQIDASETVTIPEE
jgi:hypothetical protein